MLNTSQSYSDEYLEQYKLQNSVADFSWEMEKYAKNSQKARELLSEYFSSQSYGQSVTECLDVFAATEPNSPICFFIHGGYWRMLSRHDSSMMAPVFHHAGATVIAIDYGLAPDYELSEIVAQCEAALSWVYEHAEQFNGDSKRIHISGSSAGGHLVGMLLANDAKRSVSQRRIQSASVISGVMDLRPMAYTAVNDWLDLDTEKINKFSPIFHVPARSTPVLVAWADGEPDAMIQQSQAYFHACKDQGCTVHTLEVTDTNHFDVILQLMSASHSLTQTIFKLMGLDILSEDDIGDRKDG